MNRITSFLLCIASLGFHSCGQSQTKHASVGQDGTYTYAAASPDGIGKFYKGREISDVMGAAGAEWLERDTRDAEENTKEALDSLHLPTNAVIADIGAGTGYYSFRLSKKVPAGIVYAVEIQEEYINFLNQRKAELKDSVVTVIKGTEQSPNLPENSTDLAFMVDVYHELAYPKEMLQALYKALKPGGQILLLEFKGEEPSIPIKPLHKTTVAQLNKEFNANGFTLAYQGEFLPVQHFILYKKE